MVTEGPYKRILLVLISTLRTSKAITGEETTSYVSGLKCVGDVPENPCPDYAESVKLDDEFWSICVSQFWLEYAFDA